MKTIRPLVLIEPQDVKLPYDDCNKAEAEFAIHENTVILPSGCDYRVNLRCANIFSFAGRKITPEGLLPGEMVEKIKKCALKHGRIDWQILLLLKN